MSSANQGDKRRRDLARIHIMANEIGLSDQTYREMLWSVARVSSAAQLDAYWRGEVIRHLRAERRAVASSRPPPPRRPTVNEDRAPLVGKIRAQLAAAGREDAYADGIARRMHGVERYEWCKPDQLRAIVAALEYDHRRRQKKAKVARGTPR